MSSDVHSDIMYAKKIDERITDLLMVYHNVARELDDYEIMELEALREFREAVAGQYGRDKWDAGISFIAETYQDTYAADIAQERFGEATQLDPWHDDEWADFYYQDGQSFTLEDIDYWTDGQS